MTLIIEVLDMRITNYLSLQFFFLIIYRIYNIYIKYNKQIYLYGF